MDLNFGIALNHLNIYYEGRINTLRIYDFCRKIRLSSFYLCSSVKNDFKAAQKLHDTYYNSSKNPGRMLTINLENYLSYIYPI